MSGKGDMIYGAKVPEVVVKQGELGQKILLSLCGVGIVFQFLAAAALPIEFICVVIYFFYNVIGMLVVRIAAVSFKFEDPTMLRMTMRIGAAMATYGIVVAITIVTLFQSEIALRLMAVCGLINVIVIVPTSIREFSYLHEARANGIGVDLGRPLNCCENLTVILFLLIANAVLILGIVLALSILGSGQTTGSLFKILFPVYIVMNIIPIVLPKIQHLIATEVRLWPVKCLIIHFFLVITTVIIFIPTFARAQSTAVQRGLGAVGVINGVLAAFAIAINAFIIYRAPRTHDPGMSMLAMEEAKPIEDDKEDNDD
uniref:Uncharacterized protein n=1 Tax=Aureoumbra lagunensis TaxID=44058 RepID=A0A7S3NRB8_9STRA|mmetsp:Transcript_13888/g.20838  ORF Transcript_13888/g.20838 Transcript_13888/m.20838 type:complete len:314 (-) Transcript_13888:386-1327(-)